MMMMIIITMMMIVIIIIFINKHQKQAVAFRTLLCFHFPTRNGLLYKRPFRPTYLRVLFIVAMTSTNWNSAPCGGQVECEMCEMSWLCFILYRPQRYRHTNVCGTSWSITRKSSSIRPKKVCKRCCKAITRFCWKARWTSTRRSATVTWCRLAVCWTPRATASLLLEVLLCTTIASHYTCIQWRKFSLVQLHNVFFTQFCDKNYDGCADA